MNGYELADEIKTMLADAESYYGEAESYLIKCEAMLRQQALEIQALHQILGYEGVAVGQDYLDECVAELIKASEK